LQFFPNFGKLFPVTFPPHCKHNLQPLGVAVMAPSKAKCAAAQIDWMMASNEKNVGIPAVKSIMASAHCFISHEQYFRWVSKFWYLAIFKNCFY